MEKRVSILIAGITLVVMGCGPNGSLEGQSSSGLAGIIDSKDTPSEEETPPSGGDGNAPVPADPPPITLGSYPWIMITSYEKSADGEFLHIEGIVLDEDDPPGIPVFSGHIKTQDKKDPYRKQTFHIRVHDKVKGLVSFTMPVSWANSSKTVGILNGPGYTNEEFEVCDLDEN